MHLISKEIIGGKKAKVIANLPYHLTTPIITKLVSLYPLFSTITIMVQEEVARRMTALPKTSDSEPVWRSYGNCRSSAIKRS